MFQKDYYYKFLVCIKHRKAYNFTRVYSHSPCFITVFHQVPFFQWLFDENYASMKIVFTPLPNEEEGAL